MTGKRPMRVGLLSIGLYPISSGGPANVAGNLARSLSELGIDVSVVFLVNELERDRLFRLKEFFGKSSGVEAHAVQVKNRLLWDFPHSLPTMVRRLIFSKMHLVHFHYYPSLRDGSIIIPSMLRISRIPQVISIHGIPSFELRLASMVQDLRNPSKLETRRKWAQLTYGTRLSFYELTKGNFERIVVPSAFMARQIINEGISPDRIVLLPNGVDIGAFSREETWALEGHPAIAFVGYTAWLKGGDILLKAFKIVLAHFPRAMLHIAGYCGTDFIALSEDLGVREHIRLYGEIPPSLVPGFLRGADMCVVPSRLESFGLTVLEAMAAGKATVATRVGGIPEIVSDGVDGLLVNPHPEDVARAVVYIWDHPDLRLKLGERAKKRAQDFSWKRVVKDYISLYQKLQC